MTGLGSSCGACKFLRRKCTSECVFAPYFCYDQGAAHFAAVHKVFGASNVSKLLSHLPQNNRSHAASTISYEALARMRDPIYGCVAHIFALQQQVVCLQEEIQFLGSQMANVTVSIAACASSGRNSNPNSDLQFSLHEDDTNAQYNQNRPTGSLNQSGPTNGNFQTFDNQMNIDFPPSFGWEDFDLAYDSYPTPLERLLEGVDRDIIACSSMLPTGSETKDCQDQ
ncbi:hypothetical protein K2173_020387 [Erythroxylum novogranatense]|uniref:LOB domain-containing protein n=1 Tax=Erythroxylum novogranatense TaxID=1862640 RepID=A0AAV8THJ6_9ROSI|nr:hypothetical protein K2173_020387 [Erythroxylum novogranatense]